jgi:hypothetical protein
MLAGRRLLVVAVLEGVLLAPALAHADDAAFADVFRRGIASLAQREQAAQAALRAVQGAHGAMNARHAAHAAQRTAATLRTRLAAEQPSSADGRRARTLIVSALGTEAASYGHIDDALRIAVTGDEPRARRLVASARRGLRRAAQQAATAARLLAATLDDGRPGTG